MSSKNNAVFKTVLSAMFLALSLVLPFLTAGIPKIGAMLCPMHLPILLCGYFCGEWYALSVGAVAPLLRFMLFSMPPVMPTGIGMCFELAAYGFVSGMLYKHLPRKKGSIYISLLGAMVIGRIIWGVVRVILFGITGSSFGWKAFMAGAFINAVPGIILQIVLIPVLVMSFNKFTVKGIKTKQS